MNNLFSKTFKAKRSEATVGINQLNTKGLRDLKAIPRKPNQQEALDKFLAQ